MSTHNVVPFYGGSDLFGARSDGELGFSLDSFVQGLLSNASRPCHVLVTAVSTASNQTWIWNGNQVTNPVRMANNELDITELVVGSFKPLNKIPGILTNFDFIWPSLFSSTFAHLWDWSGKVRCEGSINVGFQLPWEKTKITSHELSILSQAFVA